MAYPKVDRAMRLAIVAGDGGTVMYGNRAAFKTLARWMTWLAKSDPRKHFEMHIPWHLESPSARGSRIKVLKRSRGRSTRPAAGFEVTVLAVEEADLDQMFKSRPRRSQTRK